MLSLRAGRYPAYALLPPAAIAADGDPGPAAGPLPLIVALHGAGGAAQHALEMFGRQARDAGVAIVATESAAGTWDGLQGPFGPDRDAIDRALAALFEQVPVDPAHICLAGFSDGASYALGLGLANGDLFTHVVAIAPGFLPPTEAVGGPAIFVAHGTEDAIFPIDRCSRRIVADLEARGLEVRYTEYDGGHHPPPAIREAAVDWFLGWSRLASP